MSGLDFAFRVQSCRVRGLGSTFPGYQPCSFSRTFEDSPGPSHDTPHLAWFWKAHPTLMSITGVLSLEKP